MMLSIAKAVLCLRQGQIVAYPTEAVFGLGCDPQNPKALQALLTLKQRAKEKGLILIASEIEQLKPYLKWQALPQARQYIVEKSWPGPYTWVVPATAAVLPWVRGQYDSVAVRVSAHPVASALCRAFKGALVSTSANLSLKAPFKEGQAVADYFDQAIAGVVKGAVGDLSAPTSITDALTGRVYR